MKITQWKTAYNSIRTSIQDEKFNLELLDDKLIEGYFYEEKIVKVETGGVKPIFQNIKIKDIFGKIVPEIKKRKGGYAIFKFRSIKTYF